MCSTAETAIVTVRIGTATVITMLIVTTTAITAGTAIRIARGIGSGAVAWSSARFGSARKEVKELRKLRRTLAASAGFFRVAALAVAARYGRLSGRAGSH